MEKQSSKGLFDFKAAAKLPQNIMFGTSSWTYPGWQGTVYNNHYRSEQELRTKCLAEYVHFPWFRIVGVDSSFYNPLSANTLQRYAAQVTPGFRWVSKVWEEITIPRYAKHERYGNKAGENNPNFLNVELFQEKILGPYAEARAAEHAGPFVFEFQMLPQELLKPPETFLEKLEQFLSQLPTDYQYAVEIRNRELLTPAYFKVLNRHNITHCFNHWTQMPPLKIQMQAAADAGGLAAPFLVARILTPLGMNYENAVDRFAPYDSLKEPLPEMRLDLARFAKRAIKKNVSAFILVNNRAEGNAPQTIDAVGRMIIEQLEQV